jgi:Prp8 binding protein
MIAACSADKNISLWKTYPPHTNTALLTQTHKAPITDLQFSLLSPSLYTCSADTSLAITDLTTGQRTRRWWAHDGIVNSIDRVRSGGGGRELVVSGGVVRVWDEQVDGREAVVELQTPEGGIPTTAVAWSQDGAQVFVGGIHNQIDVYDIRKQAILYSLQGSFAFPFLSSCLPALAFRPFPNPFSRDAPHQIREEPMLMSLLLLFFFPLGHTDTIASLSLSPNGQNLLSSSFDSTLISWDVKPFSVSPNRVHRTYHGNTAGFESTLSRCAWSLDDGGRRVAVGGGDRAVTIWDANSQEILYKLPGHRGTVTGQSWDPFLISLAR